jgi:hypothetical protein
MSRRALSVPDFTRKSSFNAHHLSVDRTEGFCRAVIIEEMMVKGQIFLSY